MKLFVVLLIVTFTVAFCQPDKVFKERVTFEKGFDFVQGGTPQTIPYTGGTTTTVDWLNITGKPAVYPSTWAIVSGKPTVFYPDLSVTNPLYRPITWKPDYETEVLNKPGEIELATALPQLNGIAFPVKTQTEINALTPVRGLVIINATDNVMQWYNGTKWVVFATTN